MSSSTLKQDFDISLQMIPRCYIDHGTKLKKCYFPTQSWDEYNTQQETLNIKQHSSTIPKDNESTTQSLPPRAPPPQHRRTSPSSQPLDDHRKVTRYSTTSPSDWESFTDRSRKNINEEMTQVPCRSNPWGAPPHIKQTIGNDMQSSSHSPKLEILTTEKYQKDFDQEKMKNIQAQELNAKMTDLTEKLQTLTEMVEQQQKDLLDLRASQEFVVKTTISDKKATTAWGEQPCDEE